MNTAGVRYYRINRAAYTVPELLCVVQWPFRLLLPYYVLRLLVWKALGANVPAKNAIADRRNLSWLGGKETADLQVRHPDLESARRALGELDFPRVCCIRWWDSHHPFDSYVLGGLDAAGSTFGGCVVMTNGDTTFSWVDFSSRLEDGRTLQHFNTHSGGQLRPHPTFIVNRCPGLTLESLFAVHCNAKQRLIGEGRRFLEGLTLDEVARLGSESYTAQVNYWRDVGLLLPDDSLGAQSGDDRSAP